MYLFAFILFCTLAFLLHAYFAWDRPWSFVFDLKRRKAVEAFVPVKDIDVLLHIGITLMIAAISSGCIVLAILPVLEAEVRVVSFSSLMEFGAVINFLTFLLEVLPHGNRFVASLKRRTNALLSRADKTGTEGVTIGWLRAMFHDMADTTWGWRRLVMLSGTCSLTLANVILLATVAFVPSVTTMGWNMASIILASIVGMPLVMLKYAFDMHRLQRFIEFVLTRATENGK